MSVTILTDVPTSELRFGDRVQHSDGNVYDFLGTDAMITDTEYVEVKWRDGNFTWETTAQPWNTWPLVVRS